MSDPVKPETRSGRAGAGGAADDGSLTAAGSRGGDGESAEHRKPVDGAASTRTPSRSPGMTIGDVRTAIDVYTGKLSEATRQLAFAGLAVVWIFRSTVTTVPAGGGAPVNVLPRELFTVVLWLVLALGADFLQYAAGALVYSVYNRLLEKRRVGRDEVHEPPWTINLPTYALFTTKAVGIVVAYVLLLRYLYEHVAFG